MRYVLARRGARSKSPAVEKIIAEERAAGLHLPQTYEKFRQACEASKERLVRLLVEENKAARRVVGYGATSKSTTILNYCGIGPDLIEFICDTTPIKQGKCTPGMHIPVKPHSVFVGNYPDTALLLPGITRPKLWKKRSLSPSARQVADSHRERLTERIS